MSFAASPVEMLSYFDPDGAQKLCVLNGSAEKLVVVDVASGSSLDVPITWTVTRAVQYTQVDEETGAEEDWALLFTPGSPVVLFVNLDRLEVEGARGVGVLSLASAVERIELVPRAASPTAVVVHQGSQALSVINLARHFDIRLPGSATLTNIAFSPTGDRLFTTVAERAVLAIIDLENGHPSQVDLPAPGLGLAVTADPAVILVDHRAPEGYLTLLDGIAPSAANQRTISGHFLAGLFNHANQERFGVPEEEEE
jgi:hypothetical protein